MGGGGHFGYGMGGGYGGGAGYGGHGDWGMDNTAQARSDYRPYSLRR